jgi:broad specificity phosphatase PhoE
MSETKQPPPTDDAADVEREIRLGRKFSLSDAIGRMGGEGMLKGASPVPPIEQTGAAIANYLRAHLDDAGGVLAQVVLRQMRTSEILIEHFDQPAVVLAGYLNQVLTSEALLKDLVREADAEWGRTLGDRPHFDREGQPPHPDDPYTLASVRHALTQLVQRAGQREE